MKVGKVVKTLITKRTSRTVRVGNLTIGGDAPIIIQSMTNTDTKDVEATVEQIKTLVDADVKLLEYLSQTWKVRVKLVSLKRD